MFGPLRRDWLAGGRFAAERLREALEQLQHFGLLLGLPAFEELFELPAACVVNRCRRGDAGFAQHKGAGPLSRLLDQTLVGELGQQWRDACDGEIEPGGGLLGGEGRLVVQPQQEPGCLRPELQPRNFGDAPVDAIAVLATRESAEALLQLVERCGVAGRGERVADALVGHGLT